MYLLDVLVWCKEYVGMMRLKCKNDDSECAVQYGERERERAHTTRIAITELVFIVLQPYRNVLL
jgi:hypothetical protein